MVVSSDKKIKTIGISGGIGSGKSVVSHILRTMGFFVFDSDQEAKTLLNTDEALQRAMVEVLGPETYQGGVYNRAFVAQQIFQHPDLLLQVNALVHPRVEKAFQKACSKQRKKGIFKESALLLKPDLKQKLNSLWVVDAPLDLRMSRVQTRDGAQQEEVMARMRNQPNPKNFLEAADFIIDNGPEKALLPQVLQGLKKEGIL